MPTTVLPTICQRCSVISTPARMPTSDLRAPGEVNRDSPVTGAAWRRVLCLRLHSPQYANAVRHTNAAHMPTSDLRAYARLTVTRQSRAPHGVGHYACDCTPRPQYANAIRHINARPYANERSPSPGEVNRDSPVTGAAWRRALRLRLHSPQYANAVRRRGVGNKIALSTKTR